MQEMKPIKNHRPDWIMLLVWAIIFSAIFYFGYHILAYLMRGF